MNETITFTLTHSNNLPHLERPNAVPSQIQVLSVICFKAYGQGLADQPRSRVASETVRTIALAIGKNTKDVVKMIDLAHTIGTLKQSITIPIQMIVQEPPRDLPPIPEDYLAQAERVRKHKGLQEERFPSLEFHSKLGIRAVKELGGSYTRDVVYGPAVYGPEYTSTKEWAYKQMLMIEQSLWMARMGLGETFAPHREGLLNLSILPRIAAILEVPLSKVQGVLQAAFNRVIAVDEVVYLVMWRDSRGDMFPEGIFRRWEDAVGVLRSGATDMIVMMPMM